jgi:3-hydroxyisobutyrate dehydrogenase-like beta-hydroxyacid dehydrogenase
MTINTIAIIGSGDMGSAVGRILGEHGYRVVTDLSGRSVHSKMLARNAGMQDLGSLSAVVGEADVLLSILPPSAAEEFAVTAAGVITAGGTGVTFADCNAVTPKRVRRIAALIEKAGAGFIDAGIVGPPPGAGPQPTRFYVSGPSAHVLSELDGKGIHVKSMGDEIGRASALKMAYAALNKGSIALRTAVLMMARRLEVDGELRDELEYSQPQVLDHMRRVIPYIAAVSARWEGEMHEIEEAFESAGITGGFHTASTWVYAMLARSELAEEKRSEQRRDRELEQAMEIFLKAVPPPGTPD